MIAGVFVVTSIFVSPSVIVYAAGTLQPLEPAAGSVLTSLPTK